MGVNDLMSGLLSDDLNPELSIRSSLLQRIRVGIVSGKTAPGEILTVPSLAKAWGVSTTPVREALLELSNSGLLEPLRNRGFRVRMPSDKDLKDLFAIRVQLEIFALSLISKIPAEEKLLLNEAAKQIAKAVETSDTMSYLSSDRAFHQRLIALGGNPRLTDMIMSLRDNMRLYGIESPAGRHRQLNSVDEHFKLVELLAAGKLEEATQLLTRHIMDWEPVFLAASQELQQ